MHYGDFLSKLEQIPLQLSKEEKLGFKSWWLRIGISSRLSLLGKQSVAWQREIESLINSCPTGASERTVKRRFHLMTIILRKLDVYETVAQMWVLELALWKSKLEYCSGIEVQSKSSRALCHYTSGADVIIPNVVEYLIDMRRD
jgi:hypothetical protein